VGPGAGLDRCGKSRPTGIRSPDLSARSESLYIINLRKYNKRTIIEQLNIYIYIYIYMQHDRTFSVVPGHQIIQTLPDLHNFKLGNFIWVIKKELK
jgi:hypothetical protein